ncbi:MAG: hypothetical protein IPM54_12025 [Polyangiaceae bacterium]|nr:hypothetical protein [Polyangiaceae bacterium]
MTISVVRKLPYGHPEKPDAGANPRRETRGQADKNNPASANLEGGADKGEA